MRVEINNKKIYIAYITHIIQGHIYVCTRGTVTGGLQNAGTGN